MTQELTWLLMNKIDFAVSEERFSRIKNDASFPEKAIKATLEYSKIKLNQFDAVAIASNKMNLVELLKRPAQWTIDDGDYW